MKGDVYSALKTRFKERSFFLEYILTSGNWSWREMIRRHSFISSFIEQNHLKTPCLGGPQRYDREQGWHGLSSEHALTECLILGEYGRELGFPGGSEGKEPACGTGDTRDPGLIPGLGRSPGEGNGNPLQYSCLEKSMDRRAWRATVHRVAKSWTWLSD